MIIFVQLNATFFSISKILVEIVLVTQLRLQPSTEARVEPLEECPDQPTRDSLKVLTPLKKLSSSE